METEIRPRLLGELLVQRGLVSDGDLAKALELQRHTGESLGGILVAGGLVRRYDLYHTLSQLWELPFIDLIQEPPDAALLQSVPIEVMIRERFVPVTKMGAHVTVAVARRPDAGLEQIIRQTLGDVPLTYRVTTDWDIDQVIRQTFRQELLDGATYGLFFRSPEESAYTVFTRRQFAVLGGLLLAGLAALYVAPLPVLLLANLAVSLVFVGTILFKLGVSYAGAAPERWETISADDVASLKDHELPVYSVLVPAYREASVVQQVLHNLSRLDYPKSKLDILILLEEDDAETIAAAKAAQPPGNVRFVIVPDQIPKTKPKALNVGLYFARGDYLVIYDAEDQPDPDQLKKAVIAFRDGPKNLACVQSALNYYNAHENALTRMFTLEYSYWFDYLLPGLHRLGLPIPLGGTSNHFRTEVLRSLGAWDPFNVTEDADLGVRASVRGYSVGIINSTTYEEASAHVGNWIRQRSRWLKGFMQTTLVFLRRPRTLIRQLGWRRTLSFLTLVGGTPVTFFVALPMWVLYGFWLAGATHSLNLFFPPALLYLSLFNFLVGNALSIYLTMLAVFRRRQYGLMGWALLTPAYCLLHSVAAWKALGQLFTRPFYWEKTSHGLSNVPSRH
jgi:hypothetical protein